MTVMMPKGTSTISIPEPSITASGNAVALKLVSLVVIVTVIKVVLEVILSLAFVLVERKGTVVVVAVVERKLAAVLAGVEAMVTCKRYNWRTRLRMSIWMQSCRSVSRVSRGQHRCLPSHLWSPEALRMLWPCIHWNETCKIQFHIVFPGNTHHHTDSM